MKRNVVTVMLCIALLAASVGCGEQQSTQVQTTAPDVTENPDLVITRKNTPDSLPDNLDFGGETFTIHHYDLNAAEWEAESMNGEVVNDAIYQRNLAVENRLNIDLQFYHSGAFGDYRSKTLETLRASILAGSGEFDLIAGYAAYITSGMGGYLANLKEVNYLDFDQPWWISNLEDEMTINGRMYYMAGDIGMSFLQCFNACLFNSSLAEDYQLGDLFDIYSDGKWTIDEMRRCVSVVTTDLNGDGVIDFTGNDRVGLSLFDRGSGLDAFLGSTRQRVTQKNDQGIPEISLNNERTVTILEKLTALFSEEGADIDLMKYYPAGQDEALKLFSSGNLLFFNGWLQAVETDMVRNMEDDWGVLPYPKLDENQEDYGVFVCDGYSLFCIPVDCKNLDRAGAVTEALAAESYRHVTEAYYSVALQSKYARGEESIEVLEDLRKNVYMDFGYNYVGIGASYVIRNIVPTKGITGFSSWYAERQSRIDAALENELAVYLD